MHDMGSSHSIIDDLWKPAVDGEYDFDFTLRVDAYRSEGSNSPTDPKYFEYGGLLTVEGVKFMVDGALGSWGAALIEPYCDNNNSKGLLMYNLDDFYSNISAWMDNDYNIATHAIGDAANRMVIDGYEKLINEYSLPTDHRLRIEHAQIVNVTDILRIGKLNIIPSMQPSHATSDMVFAESRLCSYRLPGAYAWERMLDAKVPALRCALFYSPLRFSTRKPFSILIRIVLGRISRRSGK